MQKITQEQITFIDNYLQKSEVIFVDVRAELIDHIATAVEEKMQNENWDFYDAFKEFMVHNKKEILKTKNYFFPAVLNFAKSLYKPYNLAIGLLIIVLFYFGKPVLGSHSGLRNIHLGLLYGIFIFAFLQLIYTYAILKKRFIYLEKATILLAVVYYFTLFSNGFLNEFHGSSLTVGITLFLFLSFLIHCFATILTFRKKYSYL